MLDNLIGNNLRMSLTGSEINHKVKALAGLNLDITGAGLYKQLIKTLKLKVLISSMIYSIKIEMKPIKI